MQACVRRGVGLMLLAAIAGNMPARAQSVIAPVQAKAFPDHAALDRYLQDREREMRFPSGARLRAARHAATGAPAIVSAKFLTQTFDVVKAPYAPTIRIKYDTPGRFGSLALYLLNGNQLHIIEYYPPVVGKKSGTLDILLPDQGWGLYAAQGKWTAIIATIDDDDGNETAYDTPSKIASIFANPALNVTNSGTPDSTPPVVSGGTVLTPVVKATAKQSTFEVSLNVSDDLSGAAAATIVVEDPNGVVWNYYPTQPPSPVMNGTMIAENGLIVTALGTWTIYGYLVCDVPNNCTQDSNPADIQKIFGTTTFQVVK